MFNSEIFNHLWHSDVEHVIFVKMILMKFDRHPDSWSDDLSQQLHVGEDPFVTNGRDPEVSLEEGVKAVQEKLD